MMTSETQFWLHSARIRTMLSIETSIAGCQARDMELGISTLIFPSTWNTKDTSKCQVTGKEPGSP